MTATLTSDRGLLGELEPVAERLLERHLSVAQEWFPHDYVPDSLGRDLDRDPWTRDHPRLDGVERDARRARRAARGL